MVKKSRIVFPWGELMPTVLYVNDEDIVLGLEELLNYVGRQKGMSSIFGPTFCRDGKVIPGKIVWEAHPSGIVIYNVEENILASAREELNIAKGRIR